MQSVFRSLRRRQLNRSHSDRHELLASAIRRIATRPVGGRLPLFTITDAAYAWGNELWAAEEDYLAILIAEAEPVSGVIVECGSGLSTLLLAAVAQQTGARLHSLEHNPEWRDRVTDALAEFGLKGAVVHHAPLRDYGGFDWYALPDSLRGGVSLVVCDGPPSDTRGGRYGALPVLAPYMSTRCTVLLDDAKRAPETQIVSRWSREFCTAVEHHETSRGCARITVSAGAEIPLSSR